MFMKLIVLEGPARGREFTIERNTQVDVGRAQDADFSLPQDLQLSRRHFVLACEDGACRIRDLSSANGTALETGQPVATDTSVPVLPRQHIRAGSSVFMLVDDPVTRTGADRIPGLRLTNATTFPAAMMIWAHPSGGMRLSVIVKATFEIGADCRVGIARRQLPVFRSDLLTDDELEAQPRFESDMVPVKLRTDILLVGHAYAPRGVPVETLHASLEIGPLRHNVAIHGDRHWLFDPAAGITRPVITRPKPFTKMPLGYERAFGGFDEHASRYCVDNLAGTGFIGACTPRSVHGVRLPNLERVDDRIRKWDDHPSPAGFGVYGKGWTPRLGYAIRLAERLAGERPPPSASGDALLFHNAAHPELQLAGYLRGDETVRLTNLSNVPTLEFDLTPLPLRIGIAGVATADAPRDRGGKPEQTANLDTLVLIPDERQYYQVFRAVLDLSACEGEALCDVSIRLAQ